MNFGFVDTVMCSYYGPSGSVLVPQQRRARANTPAVWYRLHLAKTRQVLHEECHCQLWTI